jgi:arylsulfatase A-like enzyme
MDLLDELGKAEDTIVIFSSDNGPEMTHPNPGDKLYFSVGDTGGLRGRKRSLYSGGVGTPFIVRWPAEVPGGRVDTTTVLAGVDVFPTLAAAAGLAVPEGYEGDGENVLSAWRGEEWERSKAMFWEWKGNHSEEANWPVLGMREGMWSLLMDEGGERVELYDLGEDRGQAVNLAEAQPERVASMMERIAAWKATLPAEAPVVAGVDRKKEKPAKPDRAAAFLNKDLDGNGELTLKEYLHRFPDPEEGKRRFPNFDKDGDGVLSREEFVTPKG